jgi:adenylyltransferase/sulfurtransferase
MTGARVKKQVGTGIPLRGVLPGQGTIKMELSRDQYIRYSRHLMLPEIKLEGQERLLRSRILLVGLGGLGAPQAFYLAAAGVGTLGLLDNQKVDLTNLQRQVIHFMDDLGSLKVDSAEKKIKMLNPGVEVIRHCTWLNSQNASEIIGTYDIVVDCSDNFPTRYLLNDICAMLGKPLVSGAISGFEGQVSVFHTKAGGPCYRCLFPEPPPPGLVRTCAEAGVLGVLPGVIGLIQSNEVIKLVLGIGEPLVGRILIYDALRLRFRELLIKRVSSCALCGDRPSIRELIDYEQFCGISHGEVAADEITVEEVTVAELDVMIASGERVVFLDVREEWEHEIYPFNADLKIPYSVLATQLQAIEGYRQELLIACCQFGWKSREAIRLLKARGFANILNLQGGIEEWLLYDSDR